MKISIIMVKNDCGDDDPPTVWAFIDKWHAEQVLCQTLVDFDLLGEDDVERFCFSHEDEWWSAENSGYVIYREIEAV